MAKAYKNSEGNMLLVLTPEQQDVLYFILSCIGGFEESSPRKHSNAIRQAMFEVGTSFIDFPTTGQFVDSIYFKDYENADSN